MGLPLAHLHCHDENGLTLVDPGGTIPVTVPLGTITCEGTTGDYTLSGGELTVAKAVAAGVLALSWHVSARQVDDTNQAGDALVAWLERDVGAGFAEVEGTWSVICGTVVTPGSIPAVGVAVGSGAGELVCQIDQGDKLRLRCDVLALGAPSMPWLRGTTQFELLGGTASSQSMNGLRVHRLPDWSKRAQVMGLIGAALATAGEQDHYGMACVLEHADGAFDALLAGTETPAEAAADLLRDYASSGSCEDGSTDPTAQRSNASVETARRAATGLEAYDTDANITPS